MMEHQNHVTGQIVVTVTLRCEAVQLNRKCSNFILEKPDVHLRC